MSRQLQRNRRVEAYQTVAADGTAIAIVSAPLGPSWQIKQITISSTSTLLPVATTYVGVNSSGVEISSTLVGTGDTDSEPNTTIRSGESLCCVWTGATPTVSCKLTVIYDEVAY